MGAERVQHEGASLRAVTTPAQRLRQLLTYGHHDEDTGEHEPGLLDWYPTVVEWTTVRSVGEAGGGGKHAPLPFNVDAMDFLGGRYWADPDLTMGAATTEQVADPAYYRDGFEPTVLQLELSVRRGLGFGPPAHYRAEPLQPKPAVEEALRWLGDATEALYSLLPMLADTVREEALRLSVRSRGMAWGARLTARRSQCQYCYQVESVWSDEDRAVCVTPTCRRRDGSRHCWEVVNGEWAEVQEPDVRGRGQVSDEQLQKWSRTA